MTTADAQARPASSRLARALRAAGRAERDVWLSIGRFVFRRPRVPAGASGFAYLAPWVRIPLLILGIWGLAWMTGLLCSYVTRPHAVGPAGIRARRGPGLDVDLPWDVVAAVSPSRDVREKAPLVDAGLSGRTLALRMQDETNVLIELEAPVTFRAGDDVHEVDAVRLWNDDLPGFLAAVRTHIP